MAEVTRPDLADVVTAEVCDYLLGVLPGADLTAWQAPDGLHVSGPAYSADQLTAALVDFMPTSRGLDPRDYRTPLPLAVRQHLAHLDSFRDAVRAKQAVTQAQAAEALADVIDALHRLVDARL